ncbi:carboxylesterase [Truncatella angustata]|uniref:Carboxylic ester hydrolase n=1 Tax=Truncatella angustata TaxID=152316 RepID=A0A9P8UY45_9PEZI|nr:carboxylesterase [Truncatella angustata]KAH6660156.1 carboxylesterase [Truncatella angustata]
MLAVNEKLWWIATLAIHCIYAQNIVASLDYGTFQGAYSAQYNISYWQKIPFAAPPVGENRFRAPQPPLAITSGTYNSSQTFDMCPQRTVNGSEDCLYLGLYGRPWTTSQPLRPVVVVFYGGAFVQGSASFTIPPSAYPVLNVSESSNMIFIYSNYRVNAFGFLPGKEVASDAYSDVNAGLLDQEAAIIWTQKYIKHFGGDPNEISIWGQSAGGGSVVAQVIGRKHDPPTFKRALESSPFWPKTYNNDDPEAQSRYDTLANLAGCAGPDSLKCLKGVDVSVIRNASYTMVSGNLYGPTSYPWGPIIDGVFLEKPLSQAAKSCDVNNQLGFSMYNTHEGENFVSSGVVYDSWVSSFLPKFSTNDIARLDALYPAVGSAESITSYNDSYTRASLIYRDSVLACPGYWTAGAAPKGGWLGEYTISPAKHASDVSYWNTVNAIQQTDPLHYKGFAGAFASFFMTGDPNALKVTAENVTGVPALTTGQEWVIDSQGFTTHNLTQFKKRCDFWREVAPRLPV